MTLANQSDETLLLLLQNSNQNAFDTIYKRYWREIYGYAFQNIGSKEDSEEILHDIMLSLWKNRETSNIQNLRIYLFIACRNQINKFYKDRIKFKKFREFQILHSLHQEIKIEDDVSAAEFESKLNRLLDKMPFKTALVFKLSKIEEQPVKVIAEKLQISEKAVEYHITKSLKFLRQNFKDYYSNN